MQKFLQKFRDIVLASHKREIRNYASETIVIIVRVLLNLLALSFVIGVWYIVTLLLDLTGAHNDPTVSLLVRLGEYALIVIAAIIMVCDICQVFLSRWRKVQKK
jgi:hypothetical protein